MESRRVSILKALSWRVIATCVTVTIAYLWSGDMKVAASIGAADSIIKIFAYYLHERAWINAASAAANQHLQVGVDAVPAGAAKSC